MLPRKAAHLIIRMYSALDGGVFWLPCPARRRAWSSGCCGARRSAACPPGYDVDTHFKPRYNPWDQRMCLIPDADLYNAITAGRAEVVTDHIDHFDATGIALKSGGHLDADIIVTATGLQLQALGGVTISLTASRSSPRTASSTRRTCSKTCPTCSGASGYTNASWTLRADMTARATAKLMALHGRSRLHPRLPASGRRADGREAGLGHQRRLCAAGAARAAQVGHQAAVECAAELPRRRHRLPVRPHRGGDGVRPGRRPGARWRGRRQRSVGPQADSPSEIFLPQFGAELFGGMVLGSAAGAEVGFRSAAGSGAGTTPMSRAAPVLMPAFGFAPAFAVVAAGSLRDRLQAGGFRRDVRVANGFARTMKVRPATGGEHQHDATDDVPHQFASAEHRCVAVLLAQIGRARLELHQPGIVRRQRQGLVEILDRVAVVAGVVVVEPFAVVPRRRARASP